MKLLSWNVNGIRAAARKGYESWFAQQKADVVSLQEVKANPEQLEPALLHPKGYHSFWHCAEKKGYSGVAVFSRQEPQNVRYGLGIPEIDREGRFLFLDFPHYTLVNGYLPHSRHDLSRLNFKLTLCDHLLGALLDLKAQGKAVILSGDYNIAHRDIDLANPGGNRKNPGFLPEEKVWMDRFLAAGFRDVFRDRYGQEGGHYTWWSYRKGVRERNVGWRVDYQCVDESLADRVSNVGHQPEVLGSDHCPVQLELRE